MVSDFTKVGQWLIETFISLWTALGKWQFIGFAVIFFPILRKLIRLFQSLINTV